MAAATDRGVSRRDAEVAVELPARPEAGRLAREALQPLAQHLHPETFAKVRLLVTELVVATMPERDSHGPLRLEVALAGGVVSGSVSRPSIEGAPRPRRWGLFLVERLADSWAVEHGSSVTFELGARARG